MLNQRKRAVIQAIIVLIGIWMVATTGFFIAKHLKVTAEKVRAYAESVDLSKLSAADRARALKRLADQLNALTLEERRRLRLDGVIDRWFREMTEEEKAAFIEATMPTGMKQMLTAFEDMPADRRQRAVDNAMKNLREARDRAAAGGGPVPGGTDAPPISAELEEKIRETGLKSFYSESSAQTKAELAPVLEELQRSMQSGGAFRGRR